MELPLLLTSRLFVVGSVSKCGHGLCTPNLINLAYSCNMAGGKHSRIQRSVRARDHDDEALDADLTYLRELELIDLSGEIGDGEYRLTIPLMADWIEQQQDADVVASRVRTEAEEENA